MQFMERKRFIVWSPAKKAKRVKLDVKIFFK